jgi:hypothetical protein
MKNPMLPKQKFDLGRIVIFTRPDGTKTKAIFYGQLATGELDIELDGIRSNSSDLDSAIGQYSSFEYEV